MTSTSIRRGRGAATSGRLIRQLSSHASLLQDVSRTPTRRGRPDAIIVPASRPASALANVIDLAAELETPLVALCSHQAQAEQVRLRMERHPQARGLVVQIGDQDDNSALLEDLATSTTDCLQAVGKGRRSNLSRKRNTGVLLGRLMGWDKVVFLDDDITVFATAISRLAAHLDHHRIAGMICRHYPDNSVACHARRLAQLPQDNFVTGAVLGVRLDAPTPRFFPDVYNEDWFFFAEAAARRQLATAGQARQARYSPFAGTGRARYEEFGDLLAEGLYALFQSIHLDNPKESFDSVTALAGARYWDSFIDARRTDLAGTIQRLEDFRDRDHCSDEVPAAIASLQTADHLYEKPENQEHTRIDAEMCARYLDMLQRDGKLWQDHVTEAPRLGTVPGAMSWLGITEWDTVRYSRPEQAQIISLSRTS